MWAAATAAVAFTAPWRLSAGLGLHRGAEPEDDAVSVAAPVVPASPIHLEIYYDSMCDFCHELFDGSVRKIWEDAAFRRRLNVTLVPGGTTQLLEEAAVTPGYRFFHPNTVYPLFECQHHSQECLGNAIQACAVDMVGAEEALPLVICMAGHGAKNRGPEKSSFACLEEIGRDAKFLEDIRTCVESDRGRRLQRQHLERGRKPDVKLLFTPWVVADGKRLRLGEDHDLLQPLCALLEEPLPTACTEATEDNVAGAFARRAGGDLGRGRPLVKAAPGVDAAEALDPNEGRNCMLARAAPAPLDVPIEAP